MNVSSGMSGNLHAWSTSAWRALVVPAAIALVLTMIASPAAMAATTGGNLAYPATHTQALPDAGATGDGLAADTVTCPSDFPNPVGGGVRIDGSDPGLDLEVHRSSPSSGGWSATGNNDTGSAASMTTFAVCAKGTYLYPSKTATIRPGHWKSLKVSCPTGTKVIGGGVSIIGGNHSDEVSASEPADGNDADHGIGDAWYGAAGDGSNVSVKIKVTAICDGSTATYHIKVHAPVILTTHHQKTTKATCPTNTRVVGGGADVSGANTSVEIHDMYPVDGPDADAIPDNGFQATGYNDGDPATRQLITFAICKDV